MKIVINACFGGFSLSPRAVMRWAELQGHECYLFKRGFTHLGESSHIPVTIDKCKPGDYIVAFDVPNINEVMGEWPANGTLAEKQACNDAYRSHDIDTRPDDRTDPLLIQTIEELGAKANGMCADLKIIEIPDGV